MFLLFFIFQVKNFNIIKIHIMLSQIIHLYQAIHIFE